MAFAKHSIKRNYRFIESEKHF